MKSPFPLVVVAILFVLYGILSAFAMIGSWFTNHIIIGLGFINIFIGIGLLKHSRIARALAMAIIWFGFFALIFGSLVASIAPVTGQLMDFKLTDLHLRVFAVVIFGLFFLLLVWMHRVLRRTEVKVLFMKQTV